MAFRHSATSAYVSRVLVGLFRRMRKRRTNACLADWGHSDIFFPIFFNFFSRESTPRLDYSDAIAALSEEMLRQTFEPGSLHRALIEP